MPPSPERRTVWIVDDSPLDAERASSALSSLYQVETFHDGAVVLEELAHQRNPDVLVLDRVMPGVSGLDVCRFVRSDPSRRMGILMVTGHGAVEQLVEGLASGANDYLSKPYATEELQARVASILRVLDLVTRAEQAEATVQRLLASSPDALLAVDAQGRLTYANPEATKVLHRRPPELIGMSIEELLPELSLGNITVGPGESLFPLPDITIREQIYSPSVRFLPSDDAARTTIALRNVTQQRRAEARRLDFYSIIAHDLRSPLTAIQLRTDAILRGKRGILSAELLSDVRKIEGNIRALVAMINDFLDLARLEGVGYKLDRQPLELAALVESTAEDFQPLIDASQLALHIERGREPVEILGDKGRLTQVLTNLIGNAIKFTPAGGSITVRATAEGEVVRVSISDTGPGISPEALPRLFDRYTRALDTQHQVAGTGLGLMIVREIVEAHGGAVGVESQQGRGSTFWFELPRGHRNDRNTAAGPR